MLLPHVAWTGFSGGAELAAGLLWRPNMASPHALHPGRGGWKAGLRQVLSHLQVISGPLHTVSPTGQSDFVEGTTTEPAFPEIGSGSCQSLKAQHYFCHILLSKQSRSPPRFNTRGPRHYFLMGGMSKNLWPPRVHHISIEFYCKKYLFAC